MRAVCQLFFSQGEFSEGCIHHGCVLAISIRAANIQTAPVSMWLEANTGLVTFAKTFRGLSREAWEPFNAFSLSSNQTVHLNEWQYWSFKKTEKEHLTIFFSFGGISHRRKTCEKSQVVFVWIPDNYGKYGQFFYKSNQQTTGSVASIQYEKMRVGYFYTSSWMGHRNTGLGFLLSHNRQTTCCNMLKMVASAESVHFLWFLCIC